MQRSVDLKLIGLIGLLLLILILAACGSASAPVREIREELASGQSVSPAEEPQAESVGESHQELAFQADAVPEAASQVRQGLLDSRQVIRTADLTIVVEDTQTAVNQLRSLANTFGGYIADANLWQVKTDIMRGSVTLRIDARQFDDAVNRIKDIALDVQRENIGSQDVTQEYTDLKSRLRNLEATEQELLALLSDVRKQTNSADEVLQVYRQLTEIRGEIEQIKGRMQYLENQVNLATINVELIPKEDKPIIQAGWQPAQTLRDALSALASAGQWLINAAIWLIVFILPVALIVAVPVGLAIMGVRRWRGQPLRESA